MNKFTSTGQTLNALVENGAQISSPTLILVKGKVIPLRTQCGPEGG